MSKSRSPTPTKQAPSPDSHIVHNDPPTISRTHSEPLFTETKQTSSTPTPVPVLRSSTSQLPVSRGVLRPAEEHLEQPMAKRLRRESLEPPEEAVSPSSDSQSGMADTEGESRRTEDTSQKALPTQPPKKKRTRTLTTPHQAAVLHALLAQSRFPTTAMREEVGRSIGLSARKVQIWFQNQRQKARRPRSQEEGSTNKPPQYGPFPTNPQPSTLSSSYMPTGGMSSMGSGYSVAGPSSRRDYETSRPEESRPTSGLLTTSLTSPPGSTMGDTPRLLGPGVPGSEHQRRPSRTFIRRGSNLPVSVPPTETRFLSSSTGSSYGNIGHSPSTSPRMQPYPIGRPATSQPSSWRDRDLASRTLPPLVRSRPSTSMAYAGRHHPFPSSAGDSPPHVSLVMPPILRRSDSPEARFAHQPPDTVGHSMTNLNLSPPYTLQPSPRWDNHLYSVPPRPASSDWSRSTHRSVSPVSARRESGSVPSIPSGAYIHHHRTPSGSSPAAITGTIHSSSLPPERTATTPPSRSGRYDPVRETFIPFTRPSTPREVSQTRISDEDEHR